MNKIDLIIASTVFLFTSCATIFSPSKDVIQFESNPSESIVYVNENRICTTPCSYQFDRNVFKNLTIQIRKEGYQTTRFALKKEFNAVAIFNTTSITSWATDAISGNMIEYGPNKYFVDLIKIGDLNKVDLGSNELLKYILVNYQFILSDIAKGSGEYLTALSKKSKKPLKTILAFKKELIAQNGAYEFYKKLSEI